MLDLKLEKGFKKTMPSEEIVTNCNSKMKKAFDVFSHELSSLRTGRANASMLDIIKVDFLVAEEP